MTLLNSFIAVQVFVMIFIIINIVNGTPHKVPGYESIYFEYEECIRQIQKAFGNNTTARDCLKYAVLYYTKGQRLPVPEENPTILEGNPIIPDEHVNYDGDQYVNVLEGNPIIPDEHVNYDGDQYFNDEYVNYDVDQYVNDDEQYNFYESQNVANNFNYPSTHVYKEPPVKVFSLEDLMSSRKIEPPIKVFTLDDLLSNYKTDEKKNESVENQNVAGTSQRFFQPPVKVFTSNDLMSNRETVENQNVEVEHENDSTQEEYEITYPMLYHKQLETMIHGQGVPKRDIFCKIYFPNDSQTCYDVLKPFGNTAKSAVKEAFRNYTLYDCAVLLNVDPDFVYIHRYVEVIADKCIAKDPSKRPALFCEELIYSDENLKKNHLVKFLT